MKIIVKIIFWGSRTLIGLWLIMPLIREIFDLEFASESIEHDYRMFFAITIPIAVLLTLVGRIKVNDKNSIIVIKVIGTCLVAFLTGIISMISLILNMCGYTDLKVLYENKTNSSTKIVLREYGCGATDSDIPEAKIYKIQKFTGLFVRTTEIDTSAIDKSEWIKVDD